uniref:Uncharacterized protein n=1 Tax=viral metagenome TaxID=1070528 RepID=A0A6M3X4I4_9ZZZZ
MTIDNETVVLVVTAIIAWEVGKLVGRLFGKLVLMHYRRR